MEENRTAVHIRPCIARLKFILKTETGLALFVLAHIAVFSWRAFPDGTISVNRRSIMSVEGQRTNLNQVPKPRRPTVAPFMLNFAGVSGILYVKIG